MRSIKPKLRRALNTVLEPRGFQLLRFQPELQTRKTITEKMLGKQSELFLSELTAALTPFGLQARDSISVESIVAFSKLLKGCPIRQQAGGGGHNLAMLLWSAIQCVQPNEIIESGVFRGFTTWVLRNAAPSARILSFDVSFAELKWRDSDASYYEADWSKVVSPAPTRGLKRVAFFDDHQSQWRRIREAAARGVEFVIFDDSYPSWCLHADADAAFPTIDMLFDDALQDGQEIAWETECGAFRYEFSAAEAQATRKVVNQWGRLPDLQMTFGYKPANLVIAKLFR